MSSKRNLRAALENGGGVRSLINSDKYEQMSEEQLRIAAFESRSNQDIDVTMKMANDNRRNTLLQKAGFDWFDIDDLTPHPDNQYSINEESINNLAGLIYTTKEIQPLVLRETESGIQILDGERRWRACKLLAEKYGDVWRMVPAHCHPLGSLTDEEALLILHSNNMGQRNLTPSERAMGFKVIADALVEWRKDDPSLKGVKTKTYLAQHFGVSERTAMTNLAIAKGLSKEGLELLDDGRITQDQAETLSRLPEEKQHLVTDAISSDSVPKESASSFINAVKEGGFSRERILPQETQPARKAPVTDTYLSKAKNALRKASRCPQSANLALLGEIKQLVKELEQREFD